MPNGKTIRQIADEIGVTRQAIYKKFKLHSTIANNIKAYSFTVDRVKYYTAEGEKIIKSLFTNNYNTPQETVDVSTEQLSSVNLTTDQVDRLTDKSTGSQDDKTQIESVFSDSNTPQATADVSTEQLTSVNLTTAQVDRLTHQLTDELTSLQDDKTQIKSVFSDSSTPQTTADVSTEQLTHQLTDIFSAQLTAKDKQIEEKDRQLSEKDLQLAEKDKQIALLMEQTNNLTQALQAAQALAAADKQQLLLQAGKQNEQLENTQKQETAKKSFFSRIFGK